MPYIRTCLERAPQFPLESYGQANPEFQAYGNPAALYFRTVISRLIQGNP